MARHTTDDYGVLRQRCLLDLAADLLVGVAPGIADMPAIKTLVRSGHAVVRTGR